MTNPFKILVVLLLPFCANAQNTDSVMISKIYGEALLNGNAYSELDYLCHRIGGRLSGSPQAAKAVEWVKTRLKEIGADNVFTQEIMVPHWVRGEKEILTVVTSKNKNAVSLNMCALGGSIATKGKSLTAEVVEVKTFDELKKLGKEGVGGKFVFFNKRMDPTKVNTFNAYGEAVPQRWAGAMQAAPFGAIGVIVRSVNPAMDDFPHTGAMGYVDSIKKIPACAVSTNDADKLSNMLKYDSKLKVNLTMNCETLAEEPSQNVIAEIKGSEFPDEYIVVGGHLDSWDTGEGAHDDGAGVVQAMEVINIFKRLGIKPKRTIRAVIFMNEENGGRGGKKYAELAKEKNEKHIAAIESDAGGFSPRGFFMEGDSLKSDKIKSWKSLFVPYEVYNWNNKGSGSDVGHLKEQDVFLLGLMPDTQRYFDVHHTSNDVFKNVNRRELELGAATEAALIYLIDQYGL